MAGDGMVDSRDYLHGGFAGHPLIRYRRYVNHYETAITNLGSLLSNPTFASRVRHVFASLGLSQQLHDLLITPIQRPPRYLMLLERATKLFAPKPVPADALPANAEDSSADPTRSLEPCGDPTRSLEPRGGRHTAPTGAYLALEAATGAVRTMVQSINEAKRESDAFLEVSAVTYLTLPYLMPYLTLPYLTLSYALA